MWKKTFFLFFINANVCDSQTKKTFDSHWKFLFYKIDVRESTIIEFYFFSISLKFFLCSSFLLHQTLFFQIFFARRDVTATRFWLLENQTSPTIHWRSPWQPNFATTCRCIYACCCLESGSLKSCCYCYCCYCCWFNQTHPFSFFI